MTTTVYKPVHVKTKNSKIYDKVTANIRGSYLLHADERTEVLIKNRIAKPIYIENPSKLSKTGCNYQSIINYLR